MGILSREQIQEMGFASVGEGVRLSDKASYYGCSRISIGNNTRIDDFCVLSAGAGGITIGNYVHIAVYVSMLGGGKITIGDFAGISGRSSIYSSNDDYSGSAIASPIIPSEFTNVTHADVVIGRHAVIGAGTIILPNVTIAEGVSIGALSLVKKDCKAFGIYVGVPARYIAERKKDLLELEKLFLTSLQA